MNIKHIFAVSSLLCLAAPFLAAQNLDPTVVVNTAYEGKLVEMHKPAFEMAVPDSVSSFALDFDYLVFEKPYKGADGFTPYVLTMKPASTMYYPMKLYLNAGAGYTLHPTLDLVWSPFRSSSFKMDVYAVHRSYVGDYRSFRPVMPYEGPLVLDSWRESGGDQAHWRGYDLMTEAGADGRYEMSSMTLGFDVSYYGLASKDLRKKRMYDAVDFKIGVSSKPKNVSYFRYDVLAAYRFAEDKIRYTTAVDDYVGEHLFDLDLTLGQVISGGHEVLFDVEAEVAAYSHTDMSATAGELAIVPHYVLKKGRWLLDAGVRVSKILRSQTPYELFGAREQVVYPDIKASFAVIHDAMRLYAGVGGGNKINTYASLLEKNHHFDTSFGLERYPLMDVTVERVSASVGAEGRIGSIFSYDLRTGYVNYSSVLMDAVMIAEKDFLPGFGYSPCQKYYAALDWRLASESFRFDGNLMYSYVWGIRNGAGLFAPAALTGDVSFEYNWGRRIYAGVDCQFATARHGSMLNVSGGEAGLDAKIPGYADLGAYFEFAVNRVFSVWARGGNLLNMSIQRNPLYVERGVSVTVGICLNL